MPVAFITGITGQDGSYMAEMLLGKGYNVVGLIRRSTRERLQNIEHMSGKIRLECGELSDSHTIERIVSTYGPDETYNFASLSTMEDNWKQPILSAEITGLACVRIMDILKNHLPDARFCQASSSEMYSASGPGSGKITELSPMGTSSPYGAAKTFAHSMVDVYRSAYNMFACSAILFNHESPRRSLSFVTRKVTMAAACIALGIERSPLDGVGEPVIGDDKILRLGNLDTARDWGYAGDYVEAMWLMLQQDKAQDYVIASGLLHTLRELCKIAFSTVGLNWEDHVGIDQRFMRPIDTDPLVGDATAAKKSLGWEPGTSFKDLVKMMVHHDMRRVENMMAEKAPLSPGPR